MLMSLMLQHVYRKGWSSQFKNSDCYSPPFWRIVHSKQEPEHNYLGQGLSLSNFIHSPSVWPQRAHSSTDSSPNKIKMAILHLKLKSKVEKHVAHADTEEKLKCLWLCLKQPHCLLFTSKRTPIFIRDYFHTVLSPHKTNMAISVNRGCVV